MSWSWWSRSAIPHPSTSSRRAGRRLSRQPRALRLEALDERRVLALLGLDLRLLADDAGQPGAPIAGTGAGPGAGQNGSIQAGDFFWVEVLAWDQRDPNALPTAAAPSPGVIGLPLNLGWDETALEFVGTTPDPDPLPNAAQSLAVSANPGDSDSHLLTTSLPLQRQLADFIAAPGGPMGPAGGCDGLADPTSCNLVGLRAVSLPAAGFGSAIGQQGAESFSRLRFRALTAGATDFVLQVAGSTAFADAALLEGVRHLVDNVVTPADASNRVIEPIVVAAAPPLGQLASLSGSVFIDVDLDGMFDSQEIGLPNVAIELHQDGVAGVIAQTTTGPDGWYHFESLQPGLYTIVETQPTGFVDSLIHVGQVFPGGATRGVAGANQISNIRLAAGEQGVDYDFGENLAAVNKRMFLNQTRPRDVLCEHVGLTCVTVQATAGADTVEVVTSPNQVEVTINGGPTQVFTKANVDIVTIDTGAGVDTVHVVGGADATVARLATPVSSLRTATMGVLLSLAERATLVCTAATGLVELRDTPANDTLTISGATAQLAAPDLDILFRSLQFPTVRAVSVHRGGVETDTAIVQANTLDELLVGKWV